MTAIRVFFADDHAVVREGLSALLASEPDIEVVGTAADGNAAVAGIVATQPDVALLDMVMPGKTGVEVIEALHQASVTPKILVLTSFAEDEQIFSAIKFGALGYLLKDTGPDELIAAVRRVAVGEVTLHPTIATRLIREIAAPSPRPLSENPLTEREVEILKYVAKGMGNQEIADALVISERTVRTHVSNILEKLHLANRTQAALYALREGFVALSDD